MARDIRLARIPQTWKGGSVKRRRLTPRQPAKPDTEAMEATITLPWPVSVNHTYERNANGGVRLATAARAFRRLVQRHVALERVPAVTLPERLRVRVECYHGPDLPPRRDLDNLDKCLLDSLQHAGVIRDDGDIDDLHFRRHRTVSVPSRLVVYIGPHLGDV